MHEPHELVALEAHEALRDVAVMVLPTTWTLVMSRVDVILPA